MAIRPQGRKRTLSKKVSSFNIYMDQVYQIRAIMESTGTTKDAPVIRVLLDEALGARRRKALGIIDSEEPPGQGTAETLNTLHVLLLKLIKREEMVFRRQTVTFGVLREALIWLSFGMIGLNSPLLPLSPTKPWSASRTSFSRLSRSRMVSFGFRRWKQISTSSLSVAEYRTLPRSWTWTIAAW